MECVGKTLWNVLSLTKNNLMVFEFEFHHILFHYLCLICLTGEIVPHKIKTHKHLSIEDSFNDITIYGLWLCYK